MSTTEHHILWVCIFSDVEAAKRQKRPGMDRGGPMEKAGQPRLRRTLGDYCDQHPGWIGGVTKAERSKEVLRVTGELIAGQVRDLLFPTLGIASDHKSNSQRRVDGWALKSHPWGCGWVDGQSPRPDYSQSPAVTWLSRSSRAHSTSCLQPPCPVNNRANCPHTRQH